MKIYVASSWRNETQPSVVAALEHAGHEVYDFRNPSMGPGARGKGKGFHWSEIDPNWQVWTPEEFRAALPHPLASDGFASDLCGMMWADAFVLVMPCGRSAHLEGWAIGAGKQAVILLSDGEPELMYELASDLCVSIEEVLVALDDQKPAAAKGGEERPSSSKTKIYRVLDDGQDFAVLGTSIAQAVERYQEWRSVYWGEEDVEEPDGGVMDAQYGHVIGAPPYSPREEG